MLSKPQRPAGMLAPGPYRASQIREGEPYELSNGHRIECMSGGQRHSLGHQAGAMSIGSDPAAPATALDLGVEWGEAKHLRAPDLSVGHFEQIPGWYKDVPLLAVEYADRGQNEAELRKKIAELLERGVRFIWVVRLNGPLHVEVHEPGKPIQRVAADGVLTAPGVLQNPVPVLALVDPPAAMEVALRNLLNRKGYASLDAVRAEAEVKAKAEGLAEGKAEGLAEGKAEGVVAGRASALLAVLRARGLSLSGAQRRAILDCRDGSMLERWLIQAATAASVAEALTRPAAPRGAGR